MSYFLNKKRGVVDIAGAALKTVNQTPESGRKVQMHRRLFMRTVSIGVAALTLNACGGGSSGSGGVGPMVESTPRSGSSTEPLWATLPTITFTEGVAGSISVAAYVTDDHALAITKNSTALPPGVTYNATTQSFVYDGIGAVGLTDGHVLTAVEV